MNETLKSLLEKSRSEIIGLRNKNEILAAQISIVEIFAAALGLKKEHGMMSPDVVCELDYKIQEIEESPKTQLY